MRSGGWRSSWEASRPAGTGEEQALVGSVLALLCLQVGPGPQGEEVFRSTKPLLVSVLTDGAAGLPARQSCATALGVCCYVAAADPEDLFSCLSCLEGIFSDPSADEGGSGLTQHGPLHCSALQAWSLLLTICPPSHIRSLLDSLWLKLPPLLSSNSVALRIVAGETIALVFELAQEMEVRWGAARRRACATETQSSCGPSSKSWLPRTASTEPRQSGGSSAPSSEMSCASSRYCPQHRLVPHALLRARTVVADAWVVADAPLPAQSGEHPEETIRFGLECLYLDSWARQRTYQAFREVLGSGICHHLQNNELLREIFSLGPPVVLDAAALKASKVSRLEKHLYNSAASKARTKARSRVRDKRADVL
ncbi:interferon-related developmental regulator 2 isoform X2 [Anser cygnoides]|uniref:interferon-related developmental regulator 2 isoform X2 n=1 Tax=Anser cygnoides TaxID=8845 RepID=UPI0034D3391A